MRPFELSESMMWLPSVPDGFSGDYRLGNYSGERIEKIMWKYLVRGVNCSRAWVRINTHMPETLNSGPLDILELSTAHGAMLEVWRHLGHRVVGTDYPWVVEGARSHQRAARKRWQHQLLERLSSLPHDNPVSDDVDGWPYQPIIESLGLDVRLHDGGALPYPFEDKSFDYVVCYQAIEAYAEPERWVEIVDEMCRIARKRIVLGFNPAPVSTREDDGMMNRVVKAWQQLQGYDRNGFRTECFTLGRTRAGVHPQLCKLIATA